MSTSVRRTCSRARAHAKHTLGRWEARVVRRRTGPLGPKPTAHPSPADRHTATRPIRGRGSGSGRWRAGVGTMECMGTVLLAAPRGYCAGVERAVDAVERALEQHGGPVYVRKQIVHNLHVVRDLEDEGRRLRRRARRGAGGGGRRCCRPTARSPTVHAEAQAPPARADRRHLSAVTKVHLEARRFAEDDRTIILIGHAGHEEVEGTSGQAPERTILVQSVAEAQRVEVPDPTRLVLPDADHPVGGRDEPDRRRAARRGSRRSRGHPARTSATQRRTVRTR